MIDAAQRERFAERGIVKLDHLIPEQVLAPARDIVHAGLQQAGAWGHGRWVGGTDPAHLKAGLKRCRKSAAFKGLLTNEVQAAAHGLIGNARLVAMQPRTQLLFTPPGSGEWTVPHNVWHLDLPRLGATEPPGVQMFTFLDAVAPRGGGTLLVAGSHRLLNGQGLIGSRGIKNRLKRTPYFRDLMDRRAPRRERFLHEQGVVDDVAVQVAELHGEPGDVYFTDMRLLHSLGPNTADTPRIMVTQRFLTETTAKALQRAYADGRPQKHDACG